MGYHSFSGQQFQGLTTLYCNASQRFLWKSLSLEPLEASNGGGLIGMCTHTNSGAEAHPSALLCTISDTSPPLPVRALTLAAFLPILATEHGDTALGSDVRET